MYFLLNFLSVRIPPPFTHPVFYYGFIAVVQVWHAAFCWIATDPVRFRPMMLFAVMEKFVFVFVVIELAKLARRDRQHFDCATWLHKARHMPKEDFKKEVEKELTGRETEPWEIIYFKLYQSQMPVIEKAIETAALMLGSDRSRGYCLEMICADFLAGANLDNGDPEMLLFSMTRFFNFLSGEQRQAFLEGLRENAP